MTTKTKTATPDHSQQAQAQNQDNHYQNQRRTASSLFSRAASQSSYGYYEALRRHPNSTVSRAGNVDWVTPYESESLSSTDPPFALLHMASYLGFSRANGGCSQKQASKIYKELVAMELAIHHFNNGMNNIITDFGKEQSTNCNLKLSASYYDSQYTPPVVVQGVTQLLTLPKTDPNNEGDVIAPGTIIGARTSSSTMPSSIISGAYNVPQLSFTATSTSLSDRFRHPLFSRVVPGDDSAAQAALRFLNDVVKTTHLAVLYVSDAFGNDYYSAVQNFNVGSDGAPRIDIEGFPLKFPPEDNDIAAQLEKLKLSRIRHVLVVAFSSHLDPTLRKAVELELLGPDFFWIVGISTSYFNNLEVDDNTSEEYLKALRGVAIVPEFGATPDSQGYARFTETWSSLGAVDVAYFNSKMPAAIRGVEECFLAPDDFFQENGPGSTAHMAFDTVIKVGRGACAALSNNTLEGKLHHEFILNNTFEGASGTVQTDLSTGSRDPLLFSYAVLNVMPQETDGKVTSLETPETIVLKPNQEIGDWELVYKNPSYPRFVFQDGSTQPPVSLPPITVDYNYIGQLRILAYFMFGIIALLSIGFASWTIAHRNVRVIRSSQPFFLCMICGGTLLMASALIPLSMDDEHYSQEATNIACMAQPWLVTLGFVCVFSALAAKTWRINQLHDGAMQFQRMVVSVKDVLIPFCVLLTANVVIMLCWTLMAPLEYVREVNSKDAWNRPISSRGSCRVADKEGAAAPYMLSLTGINLACLLFANWQSYRARHIHTEFSESRYIGLIMLFTLQAWLTGIPLIALVYELAQPHFVVVTLIVSLTCLVMLLLIFLPKIKYASRWMKRASPDQRSTLGPAMGDEADLQNEGLRVYRTRSDMMSTSLRNLDPRKSSFQQSYSSPQDLQQYIDESSSIRRKNHDTDLSTRHEVELSAIEDCAEEESAPLDEQAPLNVGEDRDVEQAKTPSSQSGAGVAEETPARLDIVSTDTDDEEEEEDEKQQVVSHSQSKLADDGESKLKRPA